MKQGREEGCSFVCVFCVLSVCGLVWVSMGVVILYCCCRYLYSINQPAVTDRSIDPLPYLIVQDVVLCYGHDVLLHASNKRFDHDRTKDRIFALDIYI